MNPLAVNVAYFLRNHAILKQRQGMLNGGVVDFFRFKRVARALLSDEYKEKAANPKNQLPPVNSLQEAKAVFALLINNRLVLRGDKLHTADAREKHLNPKKGFPCFVPLPKAELADDEYYIWLYQKKSVWDSLLGFAVIIGVFAVICFPLWPQFMRKGVWYLSVLFLGLLGLLFVIAIIRLILFIITYYTVKPGLWIFPNLFEDVGFFDSFKPLYAWNVPKQKKAKSSKTADKPVAKPSSEKIESSTGSTGAAPAAGTVKRRVVLEEVDE